MLSMSSECGSCSSEHSDLNSVILDTLSLTNKTSWAINVTVEGGQVKFKVDTGAEVGCVTGYQVILVIRIFAKTYPFE